MMYALLLAASAVVAPVGTDAAAAIAACAPDQPSACSAARKPRVLALRPGKRCHPDPTKSKSCREILPDRNARKEAALAAVR